MYFSHVQFLVPPAFHLCSFGHFWAYKYTAIVPCPKIWSRFIACKQFLAKFCKMSWFKSLFFCFFIASPARQLLLAHNSLEQNIVFFFIYKLHTGCHLCLNSLFSIICLPYSYCNWDPAVLVLCGGFWWHIDVTFSQNDLRSHLNISTL